MCEPGKGPAVTNHAKRLTNVARRQDYPNSRPRDAATLIVIDRSGGEPKILMGRRHERHVFMPGKFVFPGGRVDASDSRILVPDRLEQVVETQLMKDMKGNSSPRRAQAIALAAIRETCEETGLFIGSRRPSGWKTGSPAWQGFVDKQISPALSALAFFCRAITPPRRPRRYDTRFFCVGADMVAHHAEPDNDELLDLHWLTFQEAMKLDLPSITRVVIDELRERLAEGLAPRPGDRVPYYFMQNGIFRRQML